MSKMTPTVAKSIANKVFSEINDVAKVKLIEKQDTLYKTVATDPELSVLNQAYENYQNIKKSLESKYDKMSVVGINKTLSIVIAELDYSTKEKLKKEVYKNVPSYEELLDDIIIKSASAELGTNLDQFIKDLVAEYSSKL